MGSLLKAQVKIRERELLLAALQEDGWNRKATAARLGISYRTILNKMKEHELGMGKDEVGGVGFTVDIYERGGSIGLSRYRGNALIHLTRRLRQGSRKSLTRN